MSAFERVSVDPSSSLEVVVVSLSVAGFLSFLSSSFFYDLGSTFFSSVALVSSLAEDASFLSENILTWLNIMFLSLIWFIL
jgi:hypothetical protein